MARPRKRRHLVVLVEVREHAPPCGLDVACRPPKVRELRNPRSAARVAAALDRENNRAVRGRLAARDARAEVYPRRVVGGPPAPATRVGLHVSNAPFAVRINVNRLETPRARPLLARVLALRRVKTKQEAALFHVRSEAVHAVWESNRVRNDHAVDVTVDLPTIIDVDIGETCRSKPRRYKLVRDALENALIDVAVVAVG
jgi:hypothetical protein